MAFALLSTKLHRPRPTAGLVARPRLTRRLDEGLHSGRRLSLVVAPAGYGKTTLVAEWLDKTPIPSAWVSLDEADNDPLRFFTYLVAALAKALGVPLAQPPPEAFPPAPQSSEALVRPWINDLVALGRPVILALDDYHQVTAAAVHEAIVSLLEHTPPHLHLVVLTRADPPFPLPRLRVRGWMTEVRDRDLRFTPEEMATFLNALHRLDLPAGQIAALEARTEGWAAGVQLAALSLQGCSPERAAEFITAFGGSHHYIVDYLVEEVLNRQPEPVREFLLQTSILDRMCAPLCDALSPHFHARQAIEALERSHLFLVPLDEERRWVRYHHLFVDALRGMAQSALPPAQLAGLHRRAGDWYRQNGFVADAVHHALLAGDGEQAAQIVQENAWSMVRRAELGTLKGWLQALPAGSLAAHPWLRIYHAWALLFSESQAAEAELHAVERQLQAGSSAEPSAEMQGHIASIRAWIAYLRGDLAGADLLARRALEACPQMDAAVRSGLTAFLAEGCLLRGDLPGCERALAQAAELAHSGGHTLLEVLSRTSLGSLSEGRGHLHEAEAAFREALRVATRARSPAAGQAYACLARLYREWNDLAAARRFSEQHVESSALWGIVDGLACGHLFQAALCQAQGDIPAADRALAQAEQVLHEHPLEVRSLAWIGATRARLWLARGELLNARRWAEERGLSPEGSLDLTNEVEYLALARLLLAERRVSDAERLLSRLQGAFESTGRCGHLVEVLVLRAAAWEMQRDTPSALAALERALSLARPGGYVRAFLDGGKPIEALLKAAAERARDRDLLAYVRTLLAAFAGEGAPPGAGQQPQPALLSERELEVLRLIAAGCSNQEIASRLVIATGTAKRHTANIFDKLDVRSRTEAVAQGRRLGLL